MPDTSELLRIEEYRALRATIRQRGSVRLIVIAITFSAWGAGILTTCALFAVPMFSLVPLTILAAGFEIVFALHVGVERIGRYIQVHHEAASSGHARWEQTAMQFSAPAGGAHPLFPTLFIVGTLLNLCLGTLFLLDVDSAPMAQNWVEMLPYAALHLVVIVRIVLASRYAAGQRARDLKEFERLSRTS